MNNIIYPLHVGTLKTKHSGLIHSGKSDIYVDAPIFMWYIDGTEENIIVDTGPANSEWGTRFHNPLTKRTDQEVEAALQKVNLRLEDIKIVINTHLHWDHCYGNTLFPNARFLVQRNELRYAAAPDLKDEKYYENKITIPPYIQMFNKFDCLDGDEQITDGIQVLSLPGHSPGMQGVLVNTQKGKYLIASDAIPTYQNLKHQVAPGIHSDYSDSLESIEKSKSYADVIIPGHDPLVLKSKYFGLTT